MLRRLNNMRTITLILLTMLASPVLAESNFSGHWRINLEETDKVVEKFKENSGIGLGGFKPTISVMGLPLPSRYRQSPMSKLAARDPKVLLCTNMGIAIGDKKVALNYDTAGEETLVKGDYRGRTSKWSKRKIEQRYKTPERTVTKTWTVRDDARLLVSVKIKQRGSKARTFNRVFDRVDPTGGQGNFD